MLLAIAGAACSDDGSGSGSGGAGSGSASADAGTTRPTDTIVPGGRRPPSTVPGPSTQSTTGGTGDPSEGIPRDQFCRGFAAVRGAETAMSDALAAEDLPSFKTAYDNLTTGYQAIAENPPDEVYEQTRAVFFAYDDLGPQVAAATSTSQLTGLALQIAGGDAADDLEAVRDYGSANC